jgi:hypothetical protein
MRRLRVTEAVANVCGPISIVRATIDQLQQKRYELERNLDQPDMQIFSIDGQRFRSETTPAEKRAALDVLNEDLSWISKNTTTTASTGSTDLSPRLRDIARDTGRGFADEYLAAQEKNLLLVSEDYGYRTLGANELKLQTTWLQPVLMLALENNALDRETYDSALIGMLESRCAFISVDGAAIANTLRNVAAPPLPAKFGLLSGVLSSSEADFASNLKMALSALAGIWNSPEISSVTKTISTGAILDQLQKHGAGRMAAVIAAAAGWSKGRIALRGDFLASLDTWQRTSSAKMDGGQRSVGTNF